MQCLFIYSALERLVTLDGKRAVHVGTEFWKAFAGASAPRLCLLIGAGWQRWADTDAAAARAWWQMAEAEQLFAPKGTNTPIPATNEDWERSLALAREATDQPARIALAQVTLTASNNRQLPTWEALSELWLQKLPVEEIRALADALVAVEPAHWSQLLEWRLRIISAPGRPPDLSALQWAASSPHSAVNVSYPAALRCWLQRDLTGTLRWLDGLPLGTEKTNLIASLGNILTTQSSPSPTP